MPWPQAAADHYRAQQRLTVATLGLVRREWATMGDDLDAGWSRVGPRVALLTASAQLGAARNGAAYVPAALEDQGIDVRPDAEVNPRAFAGVASSLDGQAYGSLDDLLYGAVVHARTAPAESLTQRLQAGGQALERLVHTQVSDAGRMAASTAITARPQVGWVRLVNPPCCQRCAVLAGKYVRSETPFKRHPRCDCTHGPTMKNRADGLVEKIEPDQIKDLTKAQRQAIADGADMGQVINSHRVGARSKDLMTTTEGTGRRGVAGRRLQGAQRLTPEGIYRVSASRDEVLKRLRDNGYIL